MQNQDTPDTNKRSVISIVFPACSAAAASTSTA